MNQNYQKLLDRRNGNKSKTSSSSGFSLEKIAKDRLKTVMSRLKKDWDLSQYKDFFPEARAMKRKHTFFVGPTNSGKSYRGFNELAQCETGLYLSPLRLLALEGQEELEKRGKLCSLLTGEEMELKESALFTASTIEMADLDTPVDCVLVDEVQMILDENRGWAWTQALVGMRSKNILMTGSEECIPTLTKLIVDYLGEELEIVRLERMVGFEVMKSHTPNLSLVEPSTAIIAFSRRAVLAIKKELEDAGRTVSVLYGNLSPGVRREEARRFRSGETEILVATDCIGMGLNLPIKIIIFSEVEKFDGENDRPLTIQEVKQIGGRAGRFGKFECGYIGAMSKDAINFVRYNMDTAADNEVRPCFVRPTLLQLEALRNQLGSTDIKASISLFESLGNHGEQIICSSLKDMLEIAEKIEGSQNLAALSFTDKHIFTCAPVSTGSTMDAFTDWLKGYTHKFPMNIQESKYGAFLNGGSANEDGVLNHAENCVKALTVYHWLSRKKSKSFPDLERCEDFREKINTYIENSLKKKGLHKRCESCGAKLQMSHKYKMCEKCYGKENRSRR
jgi:ATP-dependent RNA helicase SUPV3L1/SUV3